MYMKLDHDPASPEENPSARMLRAVECIARLGPMTYDALRTELGISKTATWRIVTTLRESGWVQVRHGGRFVQLDPRLDDMFATSHYADREFSSVLESLSEVSKAHDVHIDLFTMGMNAEPVLTDTTRRLTVSVSTPEEFDESIALAIQVAMTSVQLTRHLTKVLETADPEFSAAIRSGKVVRHIRSLHGFVWSTQEEAVSIALRGPMGTPAALRIVPRSRKADRATLSATFADIRARLSGVVEAFGKPGQDPR
jgi:biotin operon repressor